MAKKAAEVSTEKVKEVTSQQDPTDASTESEGKSSEGAGEAVTPAASRKITIDGAGLMTVSVNGVPMEFERGVEHEVLPDVFKALKDQGYIKGDKE